ncbi:hypothetical protein AB4254_12145 [Vibrio breoganii]
MLSDYIKANYKAMAHAKPALYISDQQNDSGRGIDFNIYLPSVEGDGYELIGTIELHTTKSRIDDDISGIDDAQYFYVNGQSGAYPGLGSMLYQIAMTYLNDISDGKGYLISDRESVSAFAEHIYHKLDNKEEFLSVDIPKSHPLYSKEIEEDIFDDLAEYMELPEDLDYDDYLESDYPNTYFNKAYSAPKDAFVDTLIERLVKQHQSNSLTGEQCQNLVDQGEDIRYKIEENYYELSSVVMNGFPDHVNKASCDVDL